MPNNAGVLLWYTASLNIVNQQHDHSRLKLKFKQDALVSVTGLPLDWPKIQGDSNNPGTVQMSNFMKYAINKQRDLLIGESVFVFFILLDCTN